MSSLYVDRKNVELKADGEALVFVENGERIGTETCGRIRFFRADQVDQVVRVGIERLGVGLGRADVHVTEDLRRIDADQFDREAVRQRHRDAGLAARGRAHQQDGFW